MRASQPKRVQKPTGLPLYVKIGPSVHGDRTPGIQELDPRYTETRTPEEQGHKTRHPPDEDAGLHGFQDFAGPGTSWDSRLRGSWDFVGFKTSWDLGIRGI